jgi:hypothetical protein
MKKQLLLSAVFFGVFFTHAQTKKWELVKNAPDTSRISGNTKIIAKDDGVFLYQMNTGVPAAAISVDVSKDGTHFTTLGILDDSLGKVEPLFSWKNEIYIRSVTTVTTYLKSADGISFKRFLPVNSTKQDVTPLAFGVVRDSLYAYCNVFQPNATAGYKDSLYFMTDAHTPWKAVYGKTSTEYYTLLNAQGQLILTSTAGYLDFPSLTKAPHLISKTAVTFYSQRWSAGQYILSYDSNHNFDNNPALLLTDTKALTTVPMPLPQSYLETDVFNITILPDQSILLNNRKLVTVPPSQSTVPLSYEFVYRTKDYGTTWTVVDSFSDNYANRKYLSAYAYQNVWYTTNALLPYQKSSDQGATWTTTTFSGTHWNSSFTAIGGEMALNGEFFSKDGATSWVPYANAFSGYTAASSSIYWRNNQLGWFFNDNNNAYYQVPPGSNTPVSIGGNNTQYFREALLVQGQIVYLYRGGYADFNSGLFYKYNSVSQQWSQISDLKQVLRANPAMYMLSDGQNLFYYDLENNIINGIFVSSDIGQTWSLLPMPALLIPGQTPVYSFYDDRSNGLYMGIHEDNRPASSVIDTIRFFKITATGCIPVAADGFVNQPGRQPNAPAAFQNLIRLSTGLYCWSVDANKTSLYLFQSADNGDNWTQIDTDALHGSVINIGEDQNGKLYVATSYDLYREGDDDDDTGNGTVTGITDPTASVWHMYPNPASDQITIISKQSVPLQVIDITGRIVLQTILKDEQTNIDISILSPGMYIVKTQTLSAKLIVH